MASDTTESPSQIAADPTTAPPDYQFDVFLSYSRKDEAFARRLEEALEHYRLPKDVRTTRPTKNRLTVFRDKHDLVPVGGDYWKTIENYLERSACLVLVCSPNARRSEYVGHEITTFLQTHEAKAVVPLLLAGRPNNEREAAPDDHAFPEALCSALSMPLAIEFTEFERTQGKVNKGRYRDAWFTLLAKIFGAERAEIERLDAKRQARRRTIFATAAVAIIAVLSVALVVAVQSRQEAVQQRDQARRLLYASNMSLAQRAFESGNIELGRGLLEPYRADDGAGQEDLRGFEWYYLWRLYNDHLAAFADTDAFAFSPDGTVFATATANAVQLRDAASMRETATITLGAPQATAASALELDRVPSITFAPDGRTVAFGDSARVMLIDIASRSAREVPVPKPRPRDNLTADRDGTEPAPDDYWDLARGGTPRFSRDGRLLAVSFGCGMVIVFDRRSLSEIARLGEGPPASGCTDFVEFSPDGRVLAYGDLYNVRLWDTATGRDLGGPEMDVSHPDRVGQVEAIAFSPDSRVLAIGDRSKQLVLWNIDSRKVVGRLTGHSDWVSAIAFSPDGNTLYTGSIDQTVRRWDVSSYRATGRVTDAVKVVATIRGHTGSINSIHASPAGTIVATAGADRTVKLWSNASGREFDAFEDVAAVSLDAGLMAKALDETITFFDARGAEPARLATVTGLNLILSPDGRTFATTEGYPTATTQLWSLNTEGRVAVRATFIGESPAFSGDGRLFAALGPERKKLMFWVAAAFRELTPINTEVAFADYFVSHDGAIVVTVDQESSRLRSWDVQSATRLASVERKMAAGVVELSPAGRLLAIADSNEVALWAIDSDAAPVPLGTHGTAVTALAFSPDGRWMASGDQGGGMKLWDLLSRSERAEFAAYKDPVNTLAFSPDARTLASGGIAAVKLYGMASMRELITLTHQPSATSEIHAVQGGEDTVQEIVFSLDGTSFATRSGNGMLRIWHGVNAATGSTARP